MLLVLYSSLFAVLWGNLFPTSYICIYQSWQELAQSSSVAYSGTELVVHHVPAAAPYSLLNKVNTGFCEIHTYINGVLLISVMLHLHSSTDGEIC